MSLNNWIRIQTEIEDCEADSAEKYHKETIRKIRYEHLRKKRHFMSVGQIIDSLKQLMTVLEIPITNQNVTDETMLFRNYISAVENNQTITVKKEGNMSYKMVTCSCCGKKRREYNVEEINGEKVCKECKVRYYKRDYFTCTEWIKYRDVETGILTIPKGYGIIQDYYSVKIAKIEHLVERGYVKCPKCGKYEKPTNMLNVEGKILCRMCKPFGYERCDYCGEYHDKGRMKITPQGRYYCNKCVEKLRYCPHCGRYDEEENFITRNGVTYCRECYRQLSERAVRSYHDSSVVYRKLTTAQDIPVRDDTCFFGFELEVSGNRGKALDFLDVENIDHEVVLMSDSSIKGGGFEIVTMPMTRNYIDEVFIPKFTAALKFLRDNDFKGHNYGGLHIHISQSAITNKQVAQLSEILYGSLRDQRIWLGITQRKSSEMNSWSKMTNRIGDFYATYTQPEEAGKASVGSPRYTALCKDDRTKTYEFRIFNSNIRIERFLKNYECVLALLDYTKLNENNPLPVCNTVGFIDYVYSNEDKYENLYRFFVERQIKEHYRNGYDDYNIERCA